MNIPELKKTDSLDTHKPEKRKKTALPFSNKKALRILKSIQS